MDKSAKTTGMVDIQIGRDETDLARRLGSDAIKWSEKMSDVIISTLPIDMEPELLSAYLDRLRKHIQSVADGYFANCIEWNRADATKRIGLDNDDAARIVMEFAGFLTTRQQVIKVGASEPVYDMLDAAAEFAKRRAHRR